MAAIKQLHRLDKGSDRKGREADESHEISKKKLVFQSGGIFQSLSEIQTTNEIDPVTGEKKVPSSFGKKWLPKHEKFGSTYNRRSWTFRGKNGRYNIFGRLCKTN